MSRERKFNEGDRVRCINENETCVSGIHGHNFDTSKSYIVKEFGMYTDGLHVLVEGSTQFVHQSKFKLETNSIMRKYLLIK